MSTPMKDRPVPLSGTWTTVEVAGHPVDLFEPSQASEHGFVVIYLHGVHLTPLGENQVFTRLFAEHGLRVACPHTMRSWWTDKICPEFDATISAERHVMQKILPFIQQKWGTAPPQIALLGTSMGGQGALRFAFKHPRTFPVVAALSPAIDYHLRVRDGDEILSAMYGDEERARQDTAILHVHPLNWPRHIWFCCDPADTRWIDSADRLRMKLYSLGIMHECDLATSAGGHGFDYYNHMAPVAIKFVAEKLERERLRVV